MRVRRRADRPPADVLDGRRALASARTKTGEWLFGTRDELVVPGRAMRWEDILTADWDSETQTMQIMEVVPSVHRFELDEPTLLLQLVRERVTASVVLTRRVQTNGELGFTAMARRPPSGGEITFTFEYDKGVDPDSPSVAEAARAALRAVREELGV